MENSATKTFDDTGHKIRRLGPACGVWATGVLELLEKVRDGFTPSFDFLTFTESWFRVHNCSDVLWDIEEFRKSLEGSLRQTLQGSNSRPPVLVVNGKPILCNLTIFYRATKTTYSARDFVVNYPSQTDLSKLSVTVENIIAFINVFGNAQVYAELRDGKRKDFDRYRSEPIIKAVMPNLIRGESMALPSELFANFCHRLIEITAERDDLPGMRKGAVSRTSECVLLNNNGLNWID
jgi:hypothetical protein